LLAGERRAGGDAERLRRVLAARLPRLPGRHLAPALAPRAPAGGDGGRGVLRLRRGVVALRPPRLAPLPDPEPPLRPDPGRVATPSGPTPSPFPEATMRLHAPLPLLAVLLLP